MMLRFQRPLLALGLAAFAIVMPAALSGTAPMSGAAYAQGLEGGTLRVGIRDDMTNYDPMQFSTVNHQRCDQRQHRRVLRFVVAPPRLGSPAQPVMQVRA